MQEARDVPVGRSRRTAAVVWGVGIAVAAVAARASPLTAVPSPAENPASEGKRVLGKILFWDEQLSADDTMACGTCHLPDRGGADSRRARHPGADGIFGTADDVFGSPGVVHRDAAGDFAPHATFGLGPQVTGRKAPSFLTGALADSLFWDGRATSRFVDPQTGLVSIAAGGALESQAVGPVLSATEMGHEGRDWAEVEAKLRTAAPLALSTEIPPDVAAVLTDATRYPDLFAAAFGDGAITAERIALAIATYERTLVPDQTPWDRFTDGDTSALDAAQQRGWNAFKGAHCIDCHAAPEFTDRSFRNIGLRPPAEDLGRGAVTAAAADRGRFKVPSLRNAALRGSFMHNGQLTTIPDVLRFYARAPGTVQFTDNRDPVIAQINLPPNAAGDIDALLETGLTDPRSAAEQFPFDYPSPYSEQKVHGPSVAGAGRAGTGGVAPTMVAVMPPYLGNSEFRLGVGDALGGAKAFLAVSSTAPVGGQLTPQEVLGPVTLASGGYGTIRWAVPDDRSRDGEPVWFQWRVADPAAAGGVALSPVAAVTLFAVKSTSAAKAHAIGDVDLFADAAAFAIDWRAHARGADADSFSSSGYLNLPAAAAADGAEFTMSVGGAEVVRATLDGRGRASSSSWSVRLDVATGRFAASGTGLDLRPVAALDATAGSGRVDRDVTVAVAGPGLAATTATATVPFAWRTAADRRTRATYRYARDGLVSGAFLVRTAQVRIGAGGAQAGRVTGVLDAVRDGTFVPAGDLTVTLGGATISLPSASRSVLGAGASAVVQYAVLGTTSGAAARFTYAARSRTFSIVCDGLSPAALPDDGSVTAAMAVRIEDASAGAVFTSSVAVRRASATSKLWSR
jgi:cytochrome c peroxidase